jgi:predicted transcriptional regulator
MKKLVISLKSPTESLENFKKALKSARKGKLKQGHYEIAFDSKKDFSRFLKNIDVLMTIQSLKPVSIYELAKILGKDQSNINKTISFFESYGIIKVKKSKQNNRMVKRPIVDYQKIEFDLEAA